jgi:2-desacetyl-2-hydroxyethyl bacteriochlorophyllide A dehydrogenase
MLAAVYTGVNQIEVKDVPIREPGPDEIVIKVAACGVCGTDLHIYHGDEGAAACPPGTVLGHEFSGTVTQIGSNVQSLAVGDRVSVDPNEYCGACYYCRNGKAHFCENMVGIGTTTHGGFAEYCTFKARQAYKIPDDLPLELAAMAEPIGCCLHGIDLCRIKTGDTVLVIGAGSIGLMMIQLAKQSGASRVIVVEPVVEKHTSAYALGASLCIDPKEADPADVMVAKGIPPVDVCIECVGLGVTVQEAFRLCGRGGTVMMFGLTPPDCEIPLKPFDVFKRELHITASFINPYTLQRSLNMIESGSIQIEPLIGARVPLKDIVTVFTDPAYRKVGKVLIVP